MQVVGWWASHFYYYVSSSISTNREVQPTETPPTSSKAHAGLFELLDMSTGAALALVFAVALCAYGNSLHGELLYDDTKAIVSNPDVRLPINWSVVM